jgi:hypothetical protein
MHGMLRTLLHRSIEISVGIVALLISGLMLWECGDMLTQPPEAAISRLTLWAILYFLAFLSLALALYGSRLIVPKLRTKGGRIIGVPGLAAFTFLYGVMFLVSLLAGQLPAVRLLPGVVVLFAGGSLLWRRLRTRADD